MSATGWENRLTRRIEATNERIAELNDTLPGDINDFYTVPTNPSPSHVDRMRSDLDALVTDPVAPGLADAGAIERLHDEVLEGLDEVYASVCRHNIPRAPNYDRR